MKLYTYFRSSSAYRVRIALNLKGIAYQAYPVHLLREENSKPEYLAHNPQGLVPTLVDGGRVFTQSLAIIEYLEERYPEPHLLPSGPVARARVRSMAQIIACDIHPLNNLRVLDYLRQTLVRDKSEILGWYRHWIEEGFVALEELLTSSPSTGTYCHGEAPSLADVCLVPQVYNARRYDVDLSAFPEIRRIHDTCLALPPFKAAAPENQPDAE